MKKFLSLVLALVMTMSLVTISAGAKDFTDSDKVTYDDAIEVMSELKVIDGYTDGSFRPTVELNRGAAAKIICNMILGPTTASALSASSAPFVDVPADSVFAGYITYCAKEGIINGYADGTFRPTAPLNGYAFMKMLLGALGYDVDIEGYTGANWSVNVAKQAIGIGLDDGNDNFVGTKHVTREEACLYALNTLQAKMVEYGNKTTVTVNGAQVVVGGSEANDVKATTKEDKFKEDGKLQFAEKYFKDLKTVSTTDDFMRPASEWKIKNKSVGVFADDADATYTEEVKGKTVYADLGSDAKDAKLTWYVDGKSADVKDFAIEKKNDEKIGGQGALTEAYFDSEAETVTIVTVNTYVLQVERDYDEDKEELKLTTVDDDDASTPAPVPTNKLTLSADEIDGLDAFAEDDIVLVTVAGDEIKSIAKAEKVTGAVTEFVKEDSVVLGGTEYEYAEKSGTAELFAYDIDEDYDAYLDTYGNIIYVKGAEADDNYVFIDEFNTSSKLTTNSKIVAYAYFTDGSEDEITVSKVAGDKVKGKDYNENNKTVNNCAANAWFTYVEKNGSYELTPVTTDGGKVSGKIVDYKDKDLKTYVKVNGSEEARATKDTVFVVLDDGDVKVYTGIKNVPAINAAANSEVRYTLDDGYLGYVFIDLTDGSHTKGGTTSSDIIFLNAFDKYGKDSSDNEYYRYKAVVNGELDKKVKFDDVTTKLSAGLYVNIEYDAETGFVTDYDQVGVDDVDEDDFDYLAVTGVQSQKAGVITFTYVNEESQTDENAKYYLADDAVIFVVKYDDEGKFDEVVTVSAKTLANDYDQAAKLYGVKNADGDYTALYVDLAH
ncbi:S-layer homology domain-containing protein [Dysosmobacter sp. Sow4_B12]|uniref:S-layer homology domain-containing protein n=1 Tax=Dysosmobacter sp. Sow4_B12 TaxID=3438777 RepID=UPI003F9232D1